IDGLPGVITSAADASRWRTHEQDAEDLPSAHGEYSAVAVLCCTLPGGAARSALLSVTGVAWSADGAGVVLGLDGVQQGVGRGQHPDPGGRRVGAGDRPGTPRTAPGVEGGQLRPPGQPLNPYLNPHLARLTRHPKIVPYPRHAPTFRGHDKIN